MDANNDTRSVSVTFNFAENVRVGQFVDGSYFAVPAAGAASLTISALSGEGGSVYADTNPTNVAHALTDNSNNYGSHDASQRLSFPLELAEATSIVAAIQKNETSHGDCGTRAIVGECIDAVFTLTVLPSVPPANAIRPSLSTPEKRILTLNDFDLTKIPHVQYFDGPDDPAKIAAVQERWLQQTEILSVPDLEGHIYSEGGRAWRSDIYGGNYGSSTARSIATSWTWVMAADLSQPEIYEQYEGLIAALLVYGQDLYYAIYDGDTNIAGWGTGAGQSHGKLVPVSIYAALKRDNAEEANNLSQLVRKVGQRFSQVPPEIEQINAGINGPIWGDGPDPKIMDKYDVTRYWASALAHRCFDGAPETCNPNSGKKTSRDPHNYIDGPGTAGTAYYSVSFGPNQAFAAMMILFPDIRTMINAGATDEFADYKDASIRFIQRVVTNGLHTMPDPCAPPDLRENPETCDAYRAKDCEYFGLSNTGVATWGPDPNDDDWTDGIECIHNNTGGNTGQNGRYSNRHGLLMEGGYRILNISDHWAEIYQGFVE